MLIVVLFFVFLICSFLSFCYLKNSIYKINFNVDTKGGNVSGVGGLVGVNLGGTIKDSYSTGEIHVKGGDAASNIKISRNSSLHITFSILCSILSISATVGIIFIKFLLKSS